MITLTRNGNYLKGTLVVGVQNLYEYETTVKLVIIEAHTFNNHLVKTKTPQTICFRLFFFRKPTAASPVTSVDG